MSQLPGGWIGCKLGDVVDYGQTVKADMDNIDDGSWVLELEDLEKDSSKILQRISFGERKPKSAKNSFKAGDVLYGKLRPYLNKMVIAPEDGVCSTEIIPLKVPMGMLNNRFIFYWLKGRVFGDYVNAVSYGVNMPRLGTKDGLNAPMVLAPTAEQIRIVEKLDEVLAQVDTIKARLDGIPALLKRFRQSALAAAVSGKLTEEWRKKRTISEWKPLVLGDLSTVATGKTPKRTSEEYWNSEDVPWLTSSATGELFCYEAEQFVSNVAVKDCNLKLFPAGTLLLAMYGEGKTRGQVTELMFDATCNQACAAIMVDENKVLKSFVKLQLLENYEETRKAAAGGNQPNLNLNKVREIGIQVPPLEEQKEIVRLVDQYFALADTIEAQVKKAQARVDKLTQAILAKAFRGELTADWRAANPDLISGDNSAAALLARIQAERATAKPRKRATKKSAT